MSVPGEKKGLRAHLRKLGGHSAVYGSQDVVSQIVNLTLTPLYAAKLTTAQFGALELLFLFTAVAKLVFRLGMDAGFFRIYYDLKSEKERRTLCGTVMLFVALAGTLLFLLIVLGGAFLGQALFGASAPEFRLWVILAASDVYLGAFSFVPQALLRIEDRPRVFALYGISRNILNTLLKVLLVLSGFGVTGVLTSDVIATGCFTIALMPLLAPRIQLSFSRPLLREVLAFGLPKAPHGVMVQLLNFADRWILQAFRGLDATGIYGKGYTLGAGVKFILSAFEPAWQPFVYSQIGRPDARPMLARIVTYIFCAFAAVALAIAVFGRELLLLLTFTNSALWAAAPVIPVVALAYALHGVFLLTSIGIGVEKKTRYYPVVTFTAAAVNISANFVLIRTFGMMGAAWATVLSYGVMASLGYGISQRVHPIPFERGRLTRVIAAALVTFLIAQLLPQVRLPYELSMLPARRMVSVFVFDYAPRVMLPSLGLKTVVLCLFPVLLACSGFLNATEQASLRQWWRRLRHGADRAS
jgi:O-antigen/teichoic acid export membrane protein